VIISLDLHGIDCLIAPVLSKEKGLFLICNFLISYQARLFLGLKYTCPILVAAPASLAKTLASDFIFICFVMFSMK